MDYIYHGLLSLICIVLYFLHESSIEHALWGLDKKMWYWLPDVHVDAHLMCRM